MSLAQKITNYHGIREIFALAALGLMFMIAPTAQASDITSQKVLELVNESRLSHGLNVIVMNDVLSDAARDKAKDMFERQYFAHDTPDGVEPWYWIEQWGYNYKYAGENLAINFTDAQKQHIAWMESPTHRKNIMNPVYDEMGVAVLGGKWEGVDTIIVVQFFGKEMGAGGQIVNNTSDKMEKLLPESARGVATQSQENVLGGLQDAITAPMLSSSDASYDKALQWIGIFFLLIVTTDILILNYIQIRNIYPIIKELLNYVRREGEIAG